MKKILAADIGGTNSRFGWFQAPRGGELELVDSIWLKTKEASSLAHLLDMLRQSEFDSSPADADLAVFAVPAAVSGNGLYADPPNIAWDIDVSNPEKDLGLPNLLLMNDFAAQAHGCRTRAVENAVVVNPGTPALDGVLAVVGAGTGFGQCALRPLGGGIDAAVPAEFGHDTFCFYGREEFEYLEFALKETGQPYPFVELIVSGRGLSLLHKFLSGQEADPAEAAKGLVPGSRMLEWFSRFYARACRDYCLAVLAVGGFYISGGLAAKNPLLVQNPLFMREFVNSPSYEELLSRIPVFLNSNQECGLWGAARYARLRLERSGAA